MSWEALIMTGITLFRGLYSSGKLDEIIEDIGPAAFLFIDPISYYATKLTSPPLPEIEQSPNLRSATPQLTVAEGSPVSMSYGLNLLAGNIVRQNDFNEADYIKIIVDYGRGMWDGILGHMINGNSYNDLAGSHSKWEHLGAVNQTGVTNLFSEDACNYRNDVVVEYKLAKGDELTSLSNITCCARTRKTCEIGYDWDEGHYSFSRNPAQILWDFYVLYKGVPVSELDENAFLSLHEYCAESCCAADENYYQVNVPLPNDVTVKATTSYENLKPCRICEEGASLLGEFTAAEGSAWHSADSNPSQQRINFDFGRKVILTKLKISNYHNAGSFTNQGIKNFVVQGSNSSSDFDYTTYADGSSTWSNVQTSLQASEHSAADEADWQEINLASSLTGYRYYSLKIADNWGNTNTMGLRHIQFFTGNAASSVTGDETNVRYAFDYIFDTKIDINDAEKILWASFNGQVIRSQGKYKPVWDAAQEPDGAGSLQTKSVKHTFTVSGSSGNVVAGSFSWNKINKPNVFIINFRDASSNFKRDTLTLKNDEDIEIRGEVVHDESCLFLIDEALAARRNKLNYNKYSYPDYECQLTGFPDSQGLELYDLCAVTDDEAGWTEKEFIVVGKSEDEYGRSVFNLEAYLSGIYEDRGYSRQKGYATVIANPNKVIPAPVAEEITASGVTGTASDSAINGPIHIQFTVPAISTYSYTEIWVSTDDSTYYKAAEDSDGDCYINGLGTYWDYGDTVYIKLVHVTVTGIKSAMPSTYQVSVNTASVVAKYAGFYFGPNDIWGGNPAIDNAATKIVMGNLDATPKFTLGGTADSITLTNASSSPGFYADGDGYFRAGGGLGHVMWDGSTFHVRGNASFDTLVFQEKVTTKGSIVIAKSGGDLYEACTATGSTFTVKVAKSVSGGAPFENGDVCHIDNGLNETWFTVGSGSDQTTYWQYTATYQSGSSSATYGRGTSITDYGQSGDVFINVSADDTHAPFMEMSEHAGSPWSATTINYRAGNLNGAADYSSDIYGMFAGVYGAASKTWVSVDQTNGFRIGNNTDILFQISIAGLSSFNLTPGSDITLIGHDSDKAKIIFNGTSYDAEIWGNTAGTAFYYIPYTSEVSSLYIGTSLNKWEHVYLRAKYTTIYGSYDADAYSQILLEGNAAPKATIRGRYDADDYAEISIESGDNSSYIDFMNLRNGTSRTLTFGSYWLLPGSTNAYVIGNDTYAFNDITSYDFSDLADYYYMDDLDDLAIINAIKGSGIIDPETGLELIDDSTINEILLAVHKTDFKDKDGNIIRRAGEKYRTEDGKYFMNNRVFKSVLMGCIRALDKENKVLKADFEAFKVDHEALKANLN